MISVHPVPPPLTYDFRSIVFAKPRNDCFWEKDTLEGAFHLGGYLDSVQKGVCSFAPLHDDLFPQAFCLYGMAVLEDSRRQGLGGLLLLAGEDRIREAGISHVWCHTPQNVREFYEKYGWEAAGDPFQTKNVPPSIKMVKDLSKPYGCKAVN